MARLRADLVKRALSKRHDKDLFLTEVKNGPTVFGNELRIIDALAIKRSWANPLITGYEIKVSRNDFLGDEKWHDYLQYCHRFSFVCPTGMIELSELPDQVGLVYYNQEKGSLYTKRKPVHQQIEVSKELLYYIVISRINDDRHPFFTNQREKLEAWVEDKDERNKLGYHVSRKITDAFRTLERRTETAENKAYNYEQDHKEVQRVKQALRAAGYSDSVWGDSRWVQNVEQAIQTSVPPAFLQAVKQIKAGVEQLEDALKEDNDE